jgi:polysaccharide deacetylase 2 family uncharacterized protein YibQ
MTQEETHTIHNQAEDLIGDFILDNEYFNANEEIFDVNTKIEPEESIETILEQDVTNTEDDINDTIQTVSDASLTDIPVIAIVVDDMGINRKRTLDIISINAPLTSSFLTYGNDLLGLVAKAQASGHEIMIHAPMEPKKANNLAPDTLKTDMNKTQIDDLFVQMLQRFDNVKVNGINNHMGSKFTEDAEKLGYVMNILKQRNMFFLDSKTSASSKGKDLAVKNDIKFVERDVFLDNNNDYDYILKQLQKAEDIAIKKGFAVAICHPKSQTYLALKDWVESLNGKQLKLVHVSEIVQKINDKN